MSNSLQPPPFPLPQMKKRDGEEGIFSSSFMGSLNFDVISEMEKGGWEQGQGEAECSAPPGKGRRSETERSLWS